MDHVTARLNMFVPQRLLLLALMVFSVVLVLSIHHSIVVEYCRESTGDLGQVVNTLSSAPSIVDRTRQLRLLLL